VKASWSSAEALWTVEVERGPERTPERHTCRFLYMCSGYYDYAQPHLPAWPDMDRFEGVVAIPQHWPEQLDYTGKRVVVIGSGATAVTLVPEMAKRAAHVTMLQRSPTYIVSRPAHDPVADWLNPRLPAGLAHALVRWKNVLMGMYFYRLARRRPERAKAFLLNLARQQVGPDFDMRHLTPSYNPWDQRICLVPDADLFVALRTGAASIVTDEIERFTADGVQLRSGETLKADVVVPATGLNIQLMGGMELAVDGKPVELGQTLSYRGFMFSGVPNLALTLGYTNASWTLKCELIARGVCRILNHMRARGYDVVVPNPPETAAASGETALPLMSGYVRRAAAVLPKQGREAPWIINQNYLKDRLELGRDSLTNGALRFSRKARERQAA
jgi:cation diffusion facilitator CzcD-associated flavoprotein CzcO